MIRRLPRRTRKVYLKRIIGFTCLKIAWICMDDFSLLVQNVAEAVIQDCEASKYCRSYLQERVWKGEGSGY